MKTVEMTLDTVAAKFDAGLANLRPLQCQQWLSQALGLLGNWNGNGRGGLHPCLSADSNRHR